VFVVFVCVILCVGLFWVLCFEELWFCCGFVGWGVGFVGLLVLCLVSITARFCFGYAVIYNYSLVG